MERRKKDKEHEGQTKLAIEKIDEIISNVKESVKNEWERTRFHHLFKEIIVLRSIIKNLNENTEIDQTNQFETNYLRKRINDFKSQLASVEEDDRVYRHEVEFEKKSKRACFTTTPKKEIDWDKTTYRVEVKEDSDGNLYPQYIVTSPPRKHNAWFAKKGKGGGHGKKK